MILNLKKTFSVLRAIQAFLYYLQLDKLETVTEKDWFGKEKTYQKGLLTDEKAGYNSYYVTDTPKLN